MTIAAVKKINWDEILETYGAEAKVGLARLLAEADIQDSDPAALIIAAMFISQIDTIKAYDSITETISSGRESLGEEFKNQITMLRGIVTYAEEHLIQTNDKQVEKRKQEMLLVIKEGIAKTLGRESSKRHRRSVAGNLSTIICVTISVIVSIGLGATGASFMLSSNDADSAVVDGQQMKGLKNGETWLSIIDRNQDELETCLVNIEELGGKCVIEVPR